MVPVAIKDELTINQINISSKNYPATLPFKMMKSSEKSHNSKGLRKNK